MVIDETFSLSRYGLNVRLVNVDDSAFIVALRTDNKLGKYIHRTDPNVDKQVEWFWQYKEREKNGEDYYFMFEKPLGNRLGVLRIYDISDTDFTIGSWVFDKQSPIGSAILAEIITREIGFELYPEKNCCWDTKKNNVNVIQYGLSYHPDVYKETEDTIYCRCTKENNDKYKKKYLRMLLR